MIIEPAELRIALGLESSINDHERSVLQVVHQNAEAAVKQHLQYDPEQRERTIYYPRTQGELQFGAGGWDVNAGHTRAIHYSDSTIRTLQLSHLPLREIDDIRVDANGHFGGGSGAFGSGTSWTEGDDYYVEWEQDNLCESGLLIAAGSWPHVLGSVKITYTAGYSPAELQGVATSNVSSGGVFTKANLSARGIVEAVMLTAVKAFKTIEENKKQSSVGFTGGTIKSEKLGDYSYTLDTGGSTGNLTSLSVSLPPEAKDLLEPYEHYGVMRL